MVESYFALKNTPHSKVVAILLFTYDRYIGIIVYCLPTSL